MYFDLQERDKLRYEEETNLLKNGTITTESTLI